MTLISCVARGCSVAGSMFNAVVSAKNASMNFSASLGTVVPQRAPH